jgi:hypothetical protein
MTKRVKVVLLLQGIILANWALSKLMRNLQIESLDVIEQAHKILICEEPSCVLDDTLDGTRDSLKSWNKAWS